jgi:hypothetical protein
MKMFQEGMWGKGGVKENGEGVNSTMIHCITVVNVTVYPQHNKN